jgi:hypothetical protein
VYIQVPTFAAKLAVQIIVKAGWRNGFQAEARGGGAAGPLDRAAGLRSSPDKRSLGIGGMMHIGRLRRSLSAAIQHLHDAYAAFATLVQKRSEALIVSANSLLYDRRVQLVNVASRYAVPTIYPSREEAEARGLLGQAEPGNSGNILAIVSSIIVPFRLVGSTSALHAVW